MPDPKSSSCGKCSQEIPVCSVRCAEHVEIADLLLAGKRAEASAYLREHLSSVGVGKASRPDG
jgi:DNA-binding GntR family transcriptional regulator